MYEIQGLWLLLTLYSCVLGQKTEDRVWKEERETTREDRGCREKRRSGKKLEGVVGVSH
jgi:hypothetical protein